jgi:hypothetical protein
MHLIRLLGEAKEFVERGEITLTQLNAAELIQIRLGEYELSELVAWANQLRPEAGEAKGHSPFARKSGQNVSRLIAGVYQDFWLGHVRSFFNKQIPKMASPIEGEHVAKIGFAFCSPFEYGSA